MTDEVALDAHNKSVLRPSQGTTYAANPSVQAVCKNQALKVLMTTGSVGGKGRGKARGKARGKPMGRGKPLGRGKPSLTKPSLV